VAEDEQEICYGRVNSLQEKNVMPNQAIQILTTLMNHRDIKLIFHTCSSKKTDENNMLWLRSSQEIG
jgi:hypothetical protein